MGATSHDFTMRRFEVELLVIRLSVIKYVEVCRCVCVREKCKILGYFSDCSRLSARVIICGELEDD